MKRRRQWGIADGRSFQARELGAELGISAASVARQVRDGRSPDEIRQLVRGEEAKRYLLVGANMRMAHYWMDERGMRRSQLGRTVFTTSMDEHVLRGRRGPIELVWADERGRAFAERALTSRERAALQVVQHINATTVMP